MNFYKLTFGVSFFFLAATGFAASAVSVQLSSLFKDDLSCYDAEMQSIAQLELWVATTGDTYPELAASGHPLAGAVDKDYDLSRSLLGMHTPEDNGLLGIPGFLWGFCCSFFGIILVLVSIDDDEIRKRETGLAALGCATGCLIWVALYVWLLAVAPY